jgi:hypothetical protein
MSIWHTRLRSITKKDCATTTSKISIYSSFTNDPTCTDARNHGGREKFPTQKFATAAAKHHGEANKSPEQMSIAMAGRRQIPERTRALLPLDHWNRVAGVGRLHPRPHIQKCTESRLQGCRGAVLKGCKSDADACSTSGPCGNAARAYSGERFGGSNESRLQLKRQGRQRRQRNKNWVFANPSVRELRCGRRRNFRRCCRHSASLHVVAGSLRAATSLVSLITASRRRRCLGRSRRRAGIDPRSKCQS